MCDRQIANIDISKEYDESLGTDDVHYQSFARMAAFFGRHMLPHRHEQYFQMHFLNSGQIELQLDDHRYSVEAPLFVLTPPSLFLSLNGVRQATDRLNNQWYINQSRTLSPTEREILRFMSRGYSMTQIAEQLKRNIKTIRAHKFNVMSKLGVSSDAGLLEAADILLCMRHCEASNVLHPY